MNYIWTNLDEVPISGMEYIYASPTTILLRALYNRGSSPIDVSGKRKRWWPLESVFESHQCQRCSFALANTFLTRETYRQLTIYVLTISCNERFLWGIHGSMGRKVILIIWISKVFTYTNSCGSNNWNLLNKDVLRMSLKDKMLYVVHREISWPSSIHNTIISNQKRVNNQLT